MFVLNKLIHYIQNSYSNCLPEQQGSLLINQIPTRYYKDLYTKSRIYLYNPIYFHAISWYENYIHYSIGLTSYNIITHDFIISIDNDKYKFVNVYHKVKI